MRKINTASLWGIILLAASYACSDKKTQPSAGDQRLNLVNKKYAAVKPLAQLINMPVYSELMDSFKLTEAQDIQLYGVGEILYNLSETGRKYYLANDDIELFFDIADTISSGRILKKYILSFADRSASKKEGIEFNGKKLEIGYSAEIKIPLKILGIQDPAEGTYMRFNIAVGDNDDGFIQKSKIALVGHSDSMSLSSKDYGFFVLAGKSAHPNDPAFYSYPGTIKADTTIEELWENIHAYPIQNVVYGFVKDKYDLSATVRSCWDKENLYFLLQIRDSRQKSITPKKIKERGIFIDYGWIENEAGERVWEMSALNSHYAGGALRNQFVDTVIHLPAGKYRIKYVSDESHSYNDWVDDPPETLFYGIIAYRKI